MGMYHCQKPDCPGHDTFSATCPENVTIQDYSTYQYPLLVSFQTMPEVKPVLTLPTEEKSETETPRVSNGSASKLKSKLNYKLKQMRGDSNPPAQMR